MITFVCWKWNSPGYRTKYNAHHVNVWDASLRRNCSIKDIRTICITDDPAGVDVETFPLWKDCDKLCNPSGKHLPSCYRRLKIFDGMTTSEMDIDEGDPVVSLDLDVVFVRDIAPMFKKIENFKGWHGIGSYNPVVYNGTLFQFRAGKAEFLWKEFDPVLSPLAANKARYFGSDQGWLSYRLNGSAPGWGMSDGIFSYTSDVRTSRAHLPERARIVSFNGKRKPWDDVTLGISPWIKDHWRL